MTRLDIKRIIAKLNLCGCGTDAEWLVIKSHLERSEDHDKNGSNYDKDNSYIEFTAKVLCSWDLTEHGSGIGWDWLTDDGKILLEFLRKYAYQDFPEWAEHEVSCSCGCEDEVLA